MNLLFVIEVLKIRQNHSSIEVRKKVKRYTDLEASVINYLENQFSPIVQNSPTFPCPIF
jgi:hypothetical protein